jgi:hypothetical protein
MLTRFHLIIQCISRQVIRLITSSVLHVIRPKVVGSNYMFLELLKTFFLLIFQAVTRIWMVEAYQCEMKCAVKTVRCQSPCVE